MTYIGSIADLGPFRWPQKWWKPSRMVQLLSRTLRSYIRPATDQYTRNLPCLNEWTSFQGYLDTSCLKWDSASCCLFTLYCYILSCFFGTLPLFVGHAWSPIMYMQTAQRMPQWRWNSPNKRGTTGWRFSDIGKLNLYQVSVMCI